MLSLRLGPSLQLSADPRNAQTNASTGEKLRSFAELTQPAVTAPKVVSTSVAVGGTPTTGLKKMEVASNCIQTIQKT